MPLALNIRVMFVRIIILTLCVHALFDLNAFVSSLDPVGLLSLRPPLGM